VRPCAHADISFIRQIYEVLVKIHKTVLQILWYGGSVTDDNSDDSDRSTAMLY
jgi:hypothetical protein